MKMLVGFVGTNKEFGVYLKLMRMLLNIKEHLEKNK